MEAAIRDEWEALQLEDYLHYIRTMPERVQVVIAARGGHTKWQSCMLDSRYYFATDFKPDCPTFVPCALVLIIKAA